MKRHQLSEVALMRKTGKLEALKHELKLLKREEALFRKKNKLLVNLIQNEKLNLKALDDEKVQLQQELIGYHYDKTSCEEDNCSLKAQYSSVIKDFQVLQTKLIDNWGEIPVARHKKASRNLSSIRNLKHHKDVVVDIATPSNVVALSSLQVEKESPTPADNMNRLQMSQTVIESKSRTTTPVDGDGVSASSKSSEQSGSSFFRRETVYLPRNSQPADLEPTRNVSINKTSQIEESTGNSDELERKVSVNEASRIEESTGNSDELESKVSVNEASPIEESTGNFDELESKVSVNEASPIEESTGNFDELESKVSVNEASQIDESTGNSDELESKVSVNEASRIEESARNSNELDSMLKVSVKDQSRIEEINLRNPNESASEDDDSLVEPFMGFVEDLAEKSRFSDKIKMLSVRLDDLRDEEIAKSITILETNPCMEKTITEPLEVDLLKQFNIRSMEVSVPKLDLAPHTLSSICQSLEVPVPEPDERGRNNISVLTNGNSLAVSPDSNSQVLKSHLESCSKTGVKETSKNKRQRLKTSSSCPKSSVERDTLPDSASDSETNVAERGTRRARKAVVSYKEKPLNAKLRRN